MSNLIPIEFESQRVVTTELLGEVYKTDVNNIQANFKRNEKHFKEGVHYFKLEGEILKDFKNQPTNSQLVSKHTSQLYLWTERGANRHCKILDTDKAWEQFDKLEETYFRVKELKEPIQPQIDSKFLFQIATQLEEKERQIGILKPKADYTDDVLKSDSLFAVTEIAKDFGFKSGQALNKVLNGFKIIRKINGKWCLYADYCGKGYAKDHIEKIKRKDGTVKTVSQLKWTEEGRKFIYEFLKKENLILNNIGKLRDRN